MNTGPDADGPRQGSAAFIRGAVATGRILPFVYCYPPRTSYLPDETPLDLHEVWARDAQGDPDLNIYIHIPFCRYRCAFCGLYNVTTRDPGADIHRRYVTSLQRNLRNLAPTLRGRRVRTVFVGGGTPLAIGVPLLVELISSLAEVFPDISRTCEEMTIEASPDAVLAVAGQLSQLVDAGVNRVSVGIQSLDPRELKRAGRGNLGPEEIISSLAHLREAGVKNIGADLIVGLDGQSDETMAQSLEMLVGFLPETLSLYLINPRGGTGFGRRMEDFPSRSPILYQRLAASAAKLLTAGYERETSVQFKLPGRGGLLHKRLYFGGQSVLGLGSGARSYTAEIGYLTGGGANRTLTEIEDYLNETTGGPTARTGVIITSEEATRRRVILGLQQLAPDWIPKTASGGFKEPYASVFAACLEMGLMTSEGSSFALTERGYLYRDIICWSLFSEQALTRHSTQGDMFGDAQRYVSAA